MVSCSDESNMQSLDTGHGGKGVLHILTRSLNNVDHGNYYGRFYDQRLINNHTYIVFRLKYDEYVTVPRGKLYYFNTVFVS